MLTKEAKSLSGYIDHVSEIHEKHGLNRWFRGAGDIRFSLVPSLVWRKQAMRESSFVHEFLVGSPSYIQRPSNPWELYGLMQHHGLPTRLLDWTRSPLVALYFALTQKVEHQADFVVWVLNPFALNKKTLGEPELFCPGGWDNRTIELQNPAKSINLDDYLPSALQPGLAKPIPPAPFAIEAPLSHARIRSQQGCFTVHGASEEPIDSHFDSSSEAIERIIFTGLARDSILKELHGLGVNEETIFQTIDGLCARICREYTSDKT